MIGVNNMEIRKASIPNICKDIGLHVGSGRQGRLWIKL